jgi:hypothetical protein
MAHIERTQFSKYEFSEWCTSNTSETILGTSDDQTPPRIRGMRMFHWMVNDPKSDVNTRLGGWQNVKTIRVLYDEALIEGKWKLDFLLIKPEREVLKERLGAEAKLAQMKAQAEALKEADEKAKADAENARKAEIKKQREERLRQLGKLKPFKKKSAAPPPHKRNGKHHARPDRHQ